MSNRILSLLSVMALAGTAAAEVSYEFVPNFITPPPGKETIGDGHGEIAVDSTGKIYVSVQDKDPALAGLQVYGKDGKFIKTLPLPPSLHGFVIRKLADGEHIYAAVLGEQKVIKCNLDGTVVMEIPTSAFPAEQRDFVTVSKSDEADPKKKTTIASGVKIADSKTEITLKLADGTEKKITKEKGVGAAGGLRLTNCDVAPNGDIYVVDGYGRSFIFVFSAEGKFKSVFGGPDKPLALANAHKIFIDTRFEPARVMICDRGHKRMLHTDLAGNFIGEIATEMRNPSSASFHGDLMCVAEIAGNVSVWDKANKRVADLGTSPAMTNTPGIPPQDWKQGIVTSPHGITFDNDGNILETEWNKWGRVLKWNVKK
ncbi:NHL repeat-containing protein [Prosthecobacter vanneervenii]|uniref:6-bladed beta-propeller n=1 Tax=Prosthecobacter vanneervenii TaxID=48466 RepID=A0A7W8DLW9_9BACT|nr:hypothetical protein [Prosthecobacter vanneervenii]MBB5034281.1 hypothetical protein [Prosthecobacter vanneervenii]